MSVVMTKEWLKALCKKTGQYTTPSLNDKLYLHFKGFEAIENLEEYTALRALFIEGNALDSLEGLSAQKELRCLFAQQNIINRISHLEEVTNLNTLNLCNNQISHISGLAHLPDLQTLQITHNKLETVEAVAHLAACPALVTVDLSDNGIDGDPEALMAVLVAMPKLQVLYLKGNPIVGKISHYRKRMVDAVANLSYLDDRPVFPNERRLASAWIRGGVEEERAERNRIKEEEAAKDRRQFAYMKSVREAALARRAAAEAAANGGLTNAELAAAAGEADGDSDDDGEWHEVPEPPELVRAREKLAQYAARPNEEEPEDLTETRARLAAEGKLNYMETRPWQPAVAEDLSVDTAMDAAAAAAASSTRAAAAAAAAAASSEVAAVEDIIAVMDCGDEEGADEEVTDLEALD